MTRQYMGELIVGQSQRRYCTILGLHMTSSKDPSRSYASCKSDRVICSRLLCVEICLQILSRYGTLARSYRRLNTVTIEPLVTLEAE